MPKSEWHYPRDESAKQIFHLLMDSPASAVSLFGPRRFGNTVFIREDLAPLADASKHRVVYASMWRMTEPPIASLLHAFGTALRGGKITDRLLKAAQGLEGKLKLKIPGTGSEIEVDVASLHGKPQNDHLLLLDQYCDQLSNDNRPALLLFDEFQELERQADWAPIIAGLRTSLDTRKHGLVSVLTSPPLTGWVAESLQRQGGAVLLVCDPNGIANSWPGICHPSTSSVQIKSEAENQQSGGYVGV